MSCIVLLLALAPPQCTAAPPSAYYATVDPTTPATLRSSLHEIIDDHTRVPYTSGATDTWDVLELAQRDPADPTRILDVYRNLSFAVQGGGGGGYDREHVWPRSYGFPINGPANMPFSDCHMLYLCDSAYNQERSNKPFRGCSSFCLELPTQPNAGNGGGVGVYPGQSNWTSGAFTSGRFEVNTFRRGDIARAMFYAAVRYEGGVHTGTGAFEPDLELTDDVSSIASSNTGQNEAIAHMGFLSTLLEWHEDDPVDDEECRRNTVVAAFQGNRNPFVDHPEWVACIFQGACGLEESYCGPAVANSSGNPAWIEGFGSLVASEEDYRLVASAMPPHVFGFFLCSREEAVVLHAGGSAGTLCLGGEIGRLVGGQVLDAGLFGSFDVDAEIGALPQPSSGGSGTVAANVGETWHFQAWFRDTVQGQATSNFTDGWRVTWQ